MFSHSRRLLIGVPTEDLAGALLQRVKDGTAGVATTLRVIAAALIILAALGLVQVFH
jgi:hypothetical protein